jgi:hypothetical protein
MVQLKVTCSLRKQRTWNLKMTLSMRLKDILQWEGRKEKEREGGKLKEENRKKPRKESVQGDNVPSAPHLWSRTQLAQAGSPHQQFTESCAFPSSEIP